MKKYKVAPEVKEQILNRIKNNCVTYNTGYKIGI